MAEKIENSVHRHMADLPRLQAEDFIFAKLTVRSVSKPGLHSYAFAMHMAMAILEHMLHERYLTLIRQVCC